MKAAVAALFAAAAVASFAACGSPTHDTIGVDGAVPTPDSSNPGTGSGSNTQQGCQGLANCYSVYAHSNDTLYVVDLMAKSISKVGKFNTPNSEVITDLAVAPDNTIYVISETALWTASPTDGHVTRVGSLATCGNRAVALTVTATGEIWEGDYMGKLCQIDITTSPPTVKPPVTMANGLALTGDLVGVGDGTVYGTAYKLSDTGSTGTQASNLLVKLTLATGAVQVVGPTAYPKLFGTSVAEGKVIGFTHDGSGRVVSIDPASGQASMFATLRDPDTQQTIAFAGAGVNALVQIVIL